MAKTPLSKSDEYELVDKDRDIRGWKVQDHAGRVLGNVDELIVDTERELITHIVLDNQQEHSIRDIELVDDRVVLGATAAAAAVAANRDTVQLETVSPPVDAKGEMRLQVLEERLRVGKRQVEQGGVRVRTEVTELPVQRQVPLLQEHVEVIRRTVDRQATSADLASLSERSVEVFERAEVPVVTKAARVVEEVVVKRDIEERSETVHETVRRKDVEVRDIKPAAIPDRLP